MSIRVTPRPRRASGATVVPGVLLAMLSAGMMTGCSSGVDVAPEPANQTAETTAPTRSPKELKIQVHTRPHDCRFPVLEVDHEVDGSLPAGADVTPAPGVVLRSLQTSPTGDVDLRITRTRKGCTGKAHLTGGGDQDVHVLGMNLHIFWPTKSRDSSGVAVTDFHIAAR